LYYILYRKGYIIKKAINIRINESLLTDLDSYAKELKCSRTYIIEKAVKIEIYSSEEVTQKRAKLQKLKQYQDLEFLEVGVDDGIK